MSSLLFDCLSELLQFIFYLKHSQDGEGYLILSFFGQFWHEIAQLLIIALLIYVSYGWTVSFDNLNDLELNVTINRYEDTHRYHLVNDLIFTSYNLEARFERA